MCNEFTGSTSQVRGLPRCKNLTRFSLFVGFCFAVRYCLKSFCFLWFTSSVSFTGSYTEVKPKFEPESSSSHKSTSNQVKNYIFLKLLF